MEKEKIEVIDLVEMAFEEEVKIPVEEIVGVDNE
ncbi:Uncharacterised protein [Streptobacillus moniliformis]|uniref:Uncharacterized protein n=1 Tax=Streptobacillus moniliformis (strain ATCC 14647 / DSM 12112 / NCTC 10651 / 9901) TaxID=519441 RepID=D1AV55_STRM9|nr:hypothetical protein Smon_1160 [Streptobacillus moniliformis DSM 12112]SQA13206.1 Uncharacterised protein [Streptobacillus moniliformis]